MATFIEAFAPYIATGVVACSVTALVDSIRFHKAYSEQKADYEREISSVSALLRTRLQEAEERGYRRGLEESIINSAEPIRDDRPRSKKQRRAQDRSRSSASAISSSRKVVGRPEHSDGPSSYGVGIGSSIGSSCGGSSFGGGGCDGGGM